MSRRPQSTHRDLRTARLRYLASLATVLLLAGGLYAKKHKDETNQLDPQKRAMHALDRLSFGPRPGDVQHLASGDIDKWIELQLHPEKIDDSAMEARLAQYRTLQMSSRELLLQFPTNPIAKAVQDGKLPMPSDPSLHAVYVAAIDRMQQNQVKKQDAPDTAKAAPATLPGTVAPTGSVATAGVAPAAKNAQPKVVSAVRVQQPQANQAPHSIIDDLIQLPPDARMQRILSLPVDEQRSITQGGVPYPKRQALFAGLSPQQRETIFALNNPQVVVNGELQSGKLLRAIYSDRQLEEVLTDFWFNHFNIFLNKGGERYLLTEYERDTIRPHVLGKFKDLLVATAKSPAMLFYLDNWQSEGPNSDAALGKPEHPPMRPPAPHRAAWPNGPFGLPPKPRPNPHPNPQTAKQQQQKRREGLNENYARELMELQTLGVNGGYTQKDVTEVARVFTGWTLADIREGGGYLYKPRLHEPGKKIVLGHTIKEDGEKEGMQVLAMLARQPATARFISTELAQRFVSDNPPPSLIDAMSKSFLKTDGDIREVLRTMFYSREFWAPEAYRARVKTPLEFVASAVRATGADISDPQSLLGTLNKMGMQLYGMQPPTGYSTNAAVWVNSSALLDRMNFGLDLSTNHMQGVSFDLAKLTSVGDGAAPETDMYQVLITLEQALLSGDVSKTTHDTIEQQISSSAAQQQNGSPAHPPGTNFIVGLLLGSPEFQRK